MRRFEGVLRAAGLLDDAALARLEADIAGEIDAAFAFARTSPLPDAANLHRNLFCE